jgi:hypothetical protein
LANYTYGGSSPLDQHHKTEKTTWVHVVGLKAWGARLCWNRLRALEAELRGPRVSGKAWLQGCYMV